MWGSGSLKSSSSGVSGESQQQTSSQAESSQQLQNTNVGGSRSSVPKSKPRSSITSILSSSLMSMSTSAVVTNPNPEPETQSISSEIELDNDAASNMDSFFDRFWSEMSVFAFERAKEIADKEKEQALKSHIHGSHCASSGFTWVILTTAMAQVALTEKGYMNLAFLAPKGFLRKDSNLKAVLESIRHDLRKIEDSAVTSSPARHKNSQVASCLTILINLRLEQMEFYDKLSVFGTSKNVEIGDLITDIEVMYEKFKEDLKAVGTTVSILDGILKTLQWEIEILIRLLKSMCMMQTWEYLDATIALQQANIQIQEWTENLQNNSTTLKKSTFYNSPPNHPLLYLWIRKLKGALVSKFSLYFYELLVKNSTPNFDMKSHCSRLPVDYYGRMLSFQKKSDALCACIIFDAKDTNYHPNAYNCAGRDVEAPQGLESFPAILSIPTKPIVHWPNVVMIISDKLHELNLDKHVGFYDSAMQATYFILRIDPKMFLVVLYETKKSEKDAYTLKFMTDLTLDLKCGKIFSSLKSSK